jgi:hypothetical protein
MAVRTFSKTRLRESAAADRMAALAQPAELMVFLQKEPAAVAGAPAAEMAAQGVPAACPGPLAARAE